MRFPPTLLYACASFVLASAAAAADVTSYCTAGVNSTGQGALISWSGPVNPFQGSLHVNNLPSGAVGIVTYGTGKQQVPFGGGFNASDAIEVVFE